METVQELIPLVKEMIAQKPSRRLVKVYVLGGVLALFGVVLVLVETVQRERQALQTQAPPEKGKQHEATLCSRALSNRQHAS
ncbi:PREDICTED: LOW QUALITY PROTEIN: G0/G1 switch protein 2 [Myotis davidii]|uniref:LOW QUALITY PROTEIN: G0/G1 switch protein 2 n=1 Tax=Myotis davidii TaxID=225400 RepID=UPI0007673AF9|nr:PREDICTED: LOW QUALITY PROTEIN: G0/G1 switch protein 2 [Myotis davidii]